ncbi:hypothetical protein LJK87_08960 [Paenibacillus sp. P25]|nr:hypothetical protein LJK87_08960 [Paenibacillus sp. P25]
MSGRSGLRQSEQGAVSIYLMLILLPVFLFCGLLIDVVRWKTAEKETENAVKAGFARRCRLSLLHSRRTACLRAA